MNISSSLIWLKTEVQSLLRYQALQKGICQMKCAYLDWNTENRVLLDCGWLIGWLVDFVMFKRVSQAEESPYDMALLQVPSLGEIIYYNISGNCGL